MASANLSSRRQLGCAPTRYSPKQVTKWPHSRLPGDHHLGESRSKQLQQRGENGAVAGQSLPARTERFADGQRIVSDQESAISQVLRGFLQIGGRRFDRWHMRCVTSAHANGDQDRDNGDGATIARQEANIGDGATVVRQGANNGSSAARTVGVRAI